MDEAAVAADVIGGRGADEALQEALLMVGARGEHATCVGSAAELELPATGAGDRSGELYREPDGMAWRYSPSSVRAAFSRHNPLREAPHMFLEFNQHRCR